jgi:hypothetical protein
VSDFVGTGDDVVAVEIHAVIADRVVELRIGPGAIVETAVLDVLIRAA